MSLPWEQGTSPQSGDVQLASYVCGDSLPKHFDEITIRKTLRSPDLIQLGTHEL